MIGMIVTGVGLPQMDGWLAALAAGAVAWLVLVASATAALLALTWYAAQRRAEARWRHDDAAGADVRTSISVGTMTGGTVAGIEEDGDGE